MSLQKFKRAVTIKMEGNEDMEPGSWDVSLRREIGVLTLLVLPIPKLARLYEMQERFRTIFNEIEPKLAASL